MLVVMLLIGASVMWMMGAAYGGWRLAFGPPANWRPEWRTMLPPVLATAVSFAALPFATGGVGGFGKQLGEALLTALITLPVATLSAWLQLVSVRAWQERVLEEQRTATGSR
ncbi:MAG: hypothetical protein U1E29_18600 [Coriobacteriia bacterium]|nr:hypothetical protein [Coriobacteriia bacterium]